jgi:hypothetical protein
MRQFPSGVEVAPAESLLIVAPNFAGLGIIFLLGWDRDGEPTRTRSYTVRRGLSMAGPANFFADRTHQRVRCQR